MTAREIAEKLVNQFLEIHGYCSKNDKSSSLAWHRNVDHMFAITEALESYGKEREREGYLRAIRDATAGLLRVGVKESVLMAVEALAHHSRSEKGDV